MRHIILCRLGDDNVKQVYKYDSSGQYIEPIIIEPNNYGEYTIPSNCTEIELPQPNWKPVFINGEWVETATEEEMLPPPMEPTQLEKLQQEQELMRQALDELILGGGGL